MRHRCCSVLSLSLVLACSSEGGIRDSASLGNDSGETGISTSGADQGSASGSGSDSDTSADTDADGDADADGGSDTTKFDLSVPDAGNQCDAGGGGGGGDGVLSYIWIANSPEGTVSKIRTQTMVEEGRYRVRPDSAGSPSRTSVALSGNVAIANRLGGVTKIYVNPEDCQESNGVPGLQTSTGAQDVLAWAQDECVAWHTPLAYASNRPLAWTKGVWDQSSCSWEQEKLWTSGANGGGMTQVLLLDGDTGAVEQTVDIPEIQSSIGLYGGAVDGDGNFWGIETGGVRLVRVDRQSFAYQIWGGPGVPSYGLAVDSQGRPWFCAGGGASRFDPLTQTWQTLPSPGGNAWGGCMTDGDGTLWHSRQLDGMLIGIDTETLTVVQQIQLPAYAHGISIDFDGYVWAVGFGSTDAYRVDPIAQTVETFTGLNGAYTYSDMTGFGLSSAGTPSG